jgi:diacylglycerol kinase (ATP)
MHGAIHLFDRLPQVDTPQPTAGGRPVAPARAEPLVGLIRNPHSHGNAGTSANLADLPPVILATPSRRNELPEILADFAQQRVDYIAIDGGDGTVRDVLTCGASAFGDSWPALIIMPSGKTNALAHDLGIAPNWSLAQALESARLDRTVIRRPLVVAQRDNESAQVRGFVMGAGAYSTAISLGQDAHDFGAFNAAVVGITTVWSLLQALFGGPGNIWRRGTRMRLRDPEGADLQHAGGLPADERYLMFSSTLEKFPAGLRPFKGIDAALRLAVLDNARRGLLLRLPRIFRGTAGRGARRRGFHAHGLDAFDFDISDRFILDGEAFPPGSYRVTPGPRLRFIVP